MLRLAVSFVLAGLFVSCSDRDKDWPLALYRGDPNRDDALLSGVLVLDGRCLYVEAGGERSFVALPAAAASWDSATGELVMGGRRARPGDRVGFAGGFPGSLDWADWEIAPDASCELSRTFAAGDQLYPGGEP